MDLLIAFLVFVGCMFAALIKGFSTVIALLVGLVCFVLVGMHRGYPLKDLTAMGTKGIRDSLIVIEVMAVIGFVTAIWRMSGTITIFVYYGMKVITPPLFLIITFLLSCLLSYALGTSFGVAGTVGVIFMTLARSGGVDPVVTAGVIMSGIYFGDRCSPVSSSANLVAGVTGTEIFNNVKLMMRTGMVPLIVSIIIYTGLSLRHPISHVDQELVTSFEESFNLSLWAFVPAALMILLPLLHASVMKAMGFSILSGALVAWLVQGVPIPDILKFCVLGYQAQGEGLGAILNGGGLSSMVEVVLIVIISSSYSGIFNETHMLESLQAQLSRACTRIGRFSVIVILSIVTSMIFCNQTITTLMCNDLLEKPYLDGGGSRQELAIDMENSVILIACTIPWTIGVMVPLSFMGVGVESMLYAFYMILVPVWYWFAKKKWFDEKSA